VSDEKLTTIAFMLHGSKCSKSWYREGRRLVGVLKRPVPQNCYTKLANQVAQEVAEENALLNQIDAGSYFLQLPISSHQHKAMAYLFYCRLVMCFALYFKCYLICEVLESWASERE